LQRDSHFVPPRSSSDLVKYLDRTVIQNGIRKKKHGHIRPAPRAIDGKETQAYGLYAIEVAVGMGHQLIALLGGGIKADGMIHPVDRKSTRLNSSHVKIS